MNSQIATSFLVCSRIRTKMGLGLGIQFWLVRSFRCTGRSMYQVVRYRLVSSIARPLLISSRTHEKQASLSVVFEFSIAF